jgi:hypothetical protein
MSLLLDDQKRSTTYIVRTLGISPNFEIAVVYGLKFHWNLRTLSLKFQKARTKIEFFLTLPDIDRKTSIWLVAF